jgi:hypothetical protein
LRRIVFDRMGGDAEGVATDLRRCRVGALLLAGGEHHIRPSVSKSLRDRQPDSPRGPGDDRGAAGQVQ